MRQIILFLILAIGLAGCGEVREAPKAEAAGVMEIRVAAAEARTVERVINVTGTLHPDEAVAVSSEVAGRVSQITVDYGDSVRKGQVIAQQDTRELELQLQRSEAMLEQALARLGLEEGTTPAIRQARAQYEDARSKFESAEKLYKSGDISRERYTELEKSLAGRKAALEAAESDLRTQLANIDALRAEKKLVEKRIADATIRAPFDGVVQERLVSPGQYLKDNAPIVRLVKSWPLRLRLDVPETAAGAIQVGDRIRFTTEALAGKEFSAVVSQLSPALDARSRSLSAEARIAQADARLRPGMFAQVRLVLEAKAEIVAVPKEAVYTIAGLRKLFTVADGRAREHVVSPGEAHDGWVEIPGGVIQAGQMVAVEKLALLTDGAGVRARK